MATQDGQPESSTARQRGSPASQSPAPSSGSRRPTRAGRGRGKGKANSPPRQASETRTDTRALISMIQSLADQVAALRNERAPSEHALPPRQPSTVRYESATPLTRSTTVLPTMEPPFDPLRHPSVARSGVTEITYGSRTYKTRDVQTLSDGIDPTYEAWSIQLDGKFLEPQFLDCEERIRMHYVFSATSGTAQGHLQTRMSRTASNPFRSVNEMLEVLETAFLNPNRVREANMEYRRLMMSITDTFVDFKTRFLLLAEEAGIPQSSRRLDLYDKLTVDLQTSLIPVLSTLTTFGDLCARAMEVDQERKWISQRVVKAKAAKLAYGRALPLTASVKQSTASSGFVTTLPSAMKTRSPSPSPRVHFSDSQARSSTPPADSKVICYNCGRPGHYAAACTNPQKPSADLSELERAIEQDSTMEDFEEQGKGEL
jgi:hypothetical protein